MRESVSEMNTMTVPTSLTSLIKSDQCQREINLFGPCQQMPMATSDFNYHSREEMKQTGKTYYVKAGEKLVVLLELHSVNDNKGQQVHSELDWFQDVHLLELLQLVQDVIQQRVEQVLATSKHQLAVAKATSPSDIITGNSLRLVYTFKKRQGHQICLISESDKDSKGQQEEKEKNRDNPDRKNYTVFQEKIIVFVCQRKQGSPHGMSKLLKVLGDMGQQTGSQTVSISSYFNKLPSLQATYTAGQSVDSQCQQGSLSQRSLHAQQYKPHEDIIQNIKLEPHESLPQAPPSEGRHHAIQKIIKRNELGMTRKRKKKNLRGVDTPAVTSAEKKDENVKTYSDKLPIKIEANSDIDSGSECNFSKNEKTCRGDDDENGVKYDSVKQSDLCVKKKDFEKKKLPNFKFKDKVNNETVVCRKKADSKVDLDSSRDCGRSETTFSKYQAKTESQTGTKSCNSISVQESSKPCNGQPEASPEKHQQNDANNYSCHSPILCLSPRTKEISDIDKCIRERHDYVAQRMVGNSPVKVMSIHTMDKVTQSTDRSPKESTRGSSNEKNYYITHSEKILQTSKQEESDKSGRVNKLCNCDKKEACKNYNDRDSKCEKRKSQIEKLGHVDDRNSCSDAAKSVPTRNIHETKSLLGKRKKYDNSDSVEDEFCSIKRDRKSEIDMKDDTYIKGETSYKDVKPNKNSHVTKKSSIFESVEDLPDLLPSGAQLMPKLLSQNNSKSFSSHVNISKGSSPLLSHGSPIGSSVSPPKGAKLSPSLSQKSPGIAEKCSRLIGRSPSLSKNSLCLSKVLQTADKEYRNLNTATTLSNKISSSSVSPDPCLISVSASSPRKVRFSDASHSQTNCTSTQKISSSDSSPFSTSSGYTIKPVNTVRAGLTQTQKGVMGSVTVVSVDAFNGMYKPASDALSSLPGSEELHTNQRTQCSNKPHVGKSFVPRTKVTEELKNMNTRVGSHCKSQSEEMSSNYSSKDGTVGRLHTLTKHHRKKRQLPDFVDPCTSSIGESSDKNHRIKRKLSYYGHPYTSLTGESNDKHQRRKRQLPDFADSSNFLTGETSEFKSKSTKADNNLEQKCSLKFGNVSRTLDRKSNEIIQTKMTDSKTINKSPTRISFLNEGSLGVDTTDLDETKEMEQDHVLLKELADEFRGITGTLMQEIKSAKHVRDLNEEQLMFLVMSSKKYLRDIFQGKIDCERHKLYKEGGKTRRDLDFRIHLGLFTEEQHDIVMERMMSIFCNKHHKYLDYLLRVLLPEMLIKIYMEVHGTSHAETDKIMASVPQNNVSS
ncbi:hypothetical protein ACJMK2_036283 [Sinanodonta woodiana]|uniref:Uncharacterized protein n=1 Tax=Sinanodonta woodiana TaxID=1069815 RepID=A0ABD3WK38_SINWO